MTLETDRLILRRWKPEDFEPYAAMMADPEVMRYLGADGMPLSRFAAWQAFCATLGHWELRGFGLFAVVERASGEVIGRIGPWYPEGWPEFEIGWTLRSQSWGKGYATEAVQACLTYAFTVLGRSRIVSLITPENASSIRVAQRVGEQFEGEITLPDLPPNRRVLQYGLTRDNWQRTSV
jgi:RimJ/RimL family protein N-acetyltransferase